MAEAAVQRQAQPGHKRVWPDVRLIRGAGTYSEGVRCDKATMCEAHLEEGAAHSNRVDEVGHTCRGGYFMLLNLGGRQEIESRVERSQTIGVPSCRVQQVGVQNIQRRARARIIATRTVQQVMLRYTPPFLHLREVLVRAPKSGPTCRTSTVFVLMAEHWNMHARQPAGSQRNDGAHHLGHGLQGLKGRGVRRKHRW